MNGDGFLLVDKPAGMTSFAVVDRVRKALLRSEPSLQAPRTRTRRGGPRPPRYKCGHTGTLDPMATGLLVVLTGRGSRLGPFLTGLGKTYAGTVRLGSETHTLDAEGEVTATAPLPEGPEALAAVLDRFRGDIMQVPPVVSALKRDGKALHARVRAGEDVAEPAARPVRIDHLEMTGARWPDPRSGRPEVDLLVASSSGTYIRSLARDLARAAGTAGHLSALRRLGVGPFRVEDAVAATALDDGAALLAALQPLAAALPAAPRLALTPAQDAAVRQGGQPEADWLGGLEDPGPAALFLMLGPEGFLTAVGRLDEGVPRVAAVFARPEPNGEERP